jgi:uncharacterized membrane protein
MSYDDPRKPPTVHVDVRILLPMAGILLGPFIGFLLSPNLGLVILMISLGLMAWMTWDLSKQVPEQQARTLRFGAILNGVFAILAAALLLVRL